QVDDLKSRVTVTALKTGAEKPELDLLKERMDRLEATMGRLEAAFLKLQDQLAKGGATGTISATGTRRLELKNDSLEDVVFYINNVKYQVAARTTLPVVMPPGRFNYAVYSPLRNEWLTEWSRNRTLSPNQVFPIRVN